MKLRGGVLSGEFGLSSRVIGSPLARAYCFWRQAASRARLPDARLTLKVGIIAMINCSINRNPPPRNTRFLEAGSPSSANRSCRILSNAFGFRFWNLEFILGFGRESIEDTFEILCCLRKILNEAMFVAIDVATFDFILNIVSRIKDPL